MATPQTPVDEEGTVLPTAFQDNQSQHLLLLLRIHLLSSLPQLLPWKHSPVAVLFGRVYLRCSFYSVAQADLELLVLLPRPSK